MIARSILPAVLLAAFMAPAWAQQPDRVPKVGLLSAASLETDPCIEPLRHALADLGQTEGQTYRFDPRFAAGQVDALPILAADLVRQNVDLIVVSSATAVEAVARATKTTPVVTASSFYPVEMGVVASLAHPGGNITGVTHFTPELMAKRVELLKEAVPNISRVAVLRLPGRIHDYVIRDMDLAARQLGLTLQPIEVRDADELEPAIDSAVRAGAQALMSTQSPFFFANSARIAQLALAHRLPTLSGEPNAPAAGILLFYGPDVLEGCGRAARYVERVLHGVKPTDLPIEQPTKIRLVVNLKTAQSLGIALPPTIVARADEVIE